MLKIYIATQEFSLSLSLYLSLCVCVCVSCACVRGGVLFNVGEHTFVHVCVMCSSSSSVVLLYLVLPVT